jgi:hypothetical protein
LSPLQSEHEEQILICGHPPLVAKGKERGMDVLHTSCAGLAVHKKTVVATEIISQEKGKPLKATRTFGTMTGDLLALSDWLMGYGITHAAMASTGEYWKPIYNILADNFEKSWKVRISSWPALLPM